MLPGRKRCPCVLSFPCAAESSQILVYSAFPLVSPPFLLFQLPRYRNRHRSHRHQRTKSTRTIHSWFEFKTLFTISLGFSHTSFKLALAGWTYSNRYHWSSISSSLYPLCVNGLIPSRRIPSSSYLCAGIGMLSKSLKSRTLLPSARLIPSCVPRSQTT